MQHGFIRPLPGKRLLLLEVLSVCLSASVSIGQPTDRDRPVGEIIRPPLIEAARRGDLAAVKARLAKGDDVDLRDEFQATAMCEAAWEGHVDIVRYLLARGADVNAANKAGYTALMGAAVHDQLELAQMLLKAGARTELEDHEGENALVLAAEADSVKVIGALIKKGVPVDARPSSGNTALVIASACGQVNAVKTLLDAGADINLPTRNGRTPLISAAENRRSEVVAVLLARGADATLTNAEGRTALDMAKMRNDQEIISLLEDAPAEKPDRKKSDRGAQTKKKRKQRAPELVATNIDGHDMNVDPNLSELVLTFDRPMNTRRYHLAIVKQKKYGRFPELVGEDPTIFRDERTFVLRFKLEADTQYAFGMNEEGRLEFRSTDGVPLEPLIYYFRTGSGNNKTEQGPPAKEEPADKMPADKKQPEHWTLFRQLVDEPTKENYLAARDFLRGHEANKPYSTDVSELADVKSQEACRKTLSIIDEGSPNLIFSPRAHLFAAMAAGKLGDEKRKQSELSVANRLIRGILSTGDGSEENPYLILRLSDEADVLMHLDKEKRGQSLVQKSGSFDVIECTDGSDVWFDISSIYGRY